MYNESKPNTVDVILNKQKFTVKLDSEAAVPVPCLPLYMYQKYFKIVLLRNTTITLVNFTSGAK